MDKEETTTTPPVDPHAGDTENPQPVAATQTTTDPHAGDSPTDIQLSLEEARKIRSESANLRQRLKDAEKLAKEATAFKAELAELKKFKEDTEAKDLSEKEKQDLAIKKKEQELAEKQAEIEKANNRIRDLTISQAVLSQASKLNIVDPEAALLFIKNDIELDDKGNATNVEGLLKDLIKEKPYLVAQQQQRQAASGGATNPSRAQTSGQSAETLVARLNQGQLSSDEYNALPRSTRDEMQKIMSKNIYR